MSDSESAPITEPEEPDTPWEEVAGAFPDLVRRAADLAFVVRERKRLEALENDARGYLLEEWEKGRADLRGIRLTNGDAVRRVWTSSAKKVSPEKLRAALADAPNYIVEIVDATRLKVDYPDRYRELGDVKSKRTIAVRLVGVEP